MFARLRSNDTVVSRLGAIASAIAFGLLFGTFDAHAISTPEGPADPVVLVITEGMGPRDSIFRRDHRNPTRASIVLYLPLMRVSGQPDGPVVDGGRGAPDPADTELYPIPEPSTALLLLAGLTLLTWSSRRRAPHA